MTLVRVCAAVLATAFVQLKTHAEEAVVEAGEGAMEVAAEVAVINSGDTAWMIVATALVLMMTLPGLALFYGGLVRSKNVLNLLGSCFALAAVMSLIWVLVGYSLAFTGAGEENNGYIGNLSLAMLAGLGPDVVSGSIPEILFAAFQMTFFIITPAILIGGVAERMKFSAMLLFCVLWGLISYLPICHMAWTEGGLFETWHVLDFAGGTVVHINAGVAALVAAVMVGKRKGYPETPMKPHNLTMTVTGAGLLWVGWFGFNAGSELAADGTAAMALMVTQISAAAGAFTWMMIEWLKNGKPSALGLASGAVAGLVGITPASGTAGPMGAIVIGAACGIGCYWGVVKLKVLLKIDDSLDAFGIHGVGGIIGAVLTGVFASESFGGFGGVAAEDISSQVFWQTASVVVTMIWSAVASVIIIFICKVVCGGIRVDEETEAIGLDLAQHDEKGYII